MSSVDAQHGSVASMEGNVPPAEPQDVPIDEVAAYSHDNVFARIYARDGDDQPGQDLEDLEADMAAYQQPVGQDNDAAQADSSLVAVGSQFD
ncbi:hypothetical protein ACHAPT_000001 [Fusarium lateritium]